MQYFRQLRSPGARSNSSDDPVHNSEDNMPENEEDNMQDNDRENEEENAEAYSIDPSDIDGGSNNSKDERRENEEENGEASSDLSDSGNEEENEEEQKTNNVTLAELCAVMTIDNCKKMNRAKKTFYKHGLENERFILWLYQSDQYRLECLVPELVVEIDDLVAEIVIPDHLKTRWRRVAKEKGSSYALRVQKFKNLKIREHVRTWTGIEGESPLKEIINFEGLTVDCFGQYVCEKRKIDGSLLKPNGYKAMRSGLSYLFKRYKQKMDETFFEQVGEMIKGAKRIANLARQGGEGNIEEGKRELSFPLYQDFNKWCAEEGTAEGVFARCFSVHSWNLACRGDSTSQIRLKHLLWKADSATISFSHSKEEQEGDDKRKRKPRHCYSNPFDWKSDYQSAVFDYLCCFPAVVSSQYSQLFPGTQDAAGKRFYYTMHMILKKHRIELEMKYGYDISDIGLHSWRKGAHTYMNSGSTAGPSAAATCIRGGHTMGSVRDIYVLHERAGDNYCGRILAGLPINDAKFAASHPDFVPVVDGMSEAELEERQVEVDESVNATLNTLFGERQINEIKTIRPFLRIGLASHLKHRNALDTAYPPGAFIRTTSLFTAANVLELQKFVKITLPWEKGGKAYATGIPPHTILLAGNEEIKTLIKGLIPQMERCMDDRTMSGNLSEARMREIVSLQTKEYRDELLDIKNILLRQMPASPNKDDLAAANSTVAGTVDGYHRWAINGFYRRVPPDWKFPLGPILNVYLYWHHGDEVKRISPLKLITRHDLTWVKGEKKRFLKNLDECQFIFGRLDAEARRKGIMVENLTRDDTIQMYYLTKDMLCVSDTTPTGRKRNWAKLTWGSVAKLSTNKKRSN